VDHELSVLIPRSCAILVIVAVFCPLVAGCASRGGEACADDSTCPDDMACVERPEGAATRSGPECALPCVSDEDCPLGDCSFPYTHRWLTCQSDGFCATESACE
jgi:hypothetical protein